MREETKKVSIPASVKAAVSERDSIDGYPCCIWCGTPAPSEARYAFSCAHYIPRQHGGLGIEENILTLCTRCHRRFDGAQRKEMQPYLRDYLKKHYPGWDENKLIYRKERKC